MICDFCGEEAILLDKKTVLGIRANMCGSCFNENSAEGVSGYSKRKSTQ